MILSKVIGTCVATQKHHSYKGHKVLVVVPIDSKTKKEKGSSFLAVDSVQAGVGDTVLVAREGNTARQIVGDESAPIHSIITGIVDDIDFI